jgi:hypothetical protein
MLRIFSVFSLYLATDGLDSGSLSSKGVADSPSELLEEDVDVEAALPVQQVDLAPLLPPLVSLTLLLACGTYLYSLLSTRALKQRKLKKFFRNMNEPVVPLCFTEWDTAYSVYCFA